MIRGGILARTWVKCPVDRTFRQVDAGLGKGSCLPTLIEAAMRRDGGWKSWLMTE